MRLRPWLGLVTLACSSTLLGCAGAPVPPAEEPKPALKVPDPEPQPAVPAGPPQDIVITTRVTHPTLFLRLAGSFGMPPITLDALAEKMLDARVSGGAPLLEPDAPIDLASTHGPKGESVVVAAQLADGGLGLLEKAFDLREPRNGLSHLERKDGGGSHPVNCVVDTLAPKARLACSTDPGRLDELGAYALHTLAPRATDGDVRVELFLAPLRDKLTQIGAKDDDGPASKLGYQLVTGLFEDLRSISLEGRLDGTDVDATLALSFQGGSPLTRAFLGQHSPPGPPVPAFYALPGDSFLAFATRGQKAEDLRPLRDILSTMLRADMLADGYAEEVVGRAFGSLESIFFTGGPLVVASGMDLEKAERAADAHAKVKKPRPADDDKARAALHPWVLLGVEEPIDRWAAALHTVEEIDKLPTPAKKAKKAGKASTDASKPPAERINHSTIRVKPMPAGIRLPKGTLHFEDRNELLPAWVKAHPREVAEGALASAPHLLHYFVVPNGPRTWIAVGADPKQLVEKLDVALAGKGGLSSRTDALELQKKTMSAAALVSLAGLSGLAMPNDSRADIAKAKELLAVLAAIPYGGRRAVPVLVTTQPEKEGGTASIHVRIPAQTAADAAKVFERW